MHSLKKKNIILELIRYQKLCENRKIILNIHFLTIMVAKFNKYVLLWITVVTLFRSQAHTSFIFVILIKKKEKLNTNEKVHINYCHLKCIEPGL